MFMIYRFRISLFLFSMSFFLMSKRWQNKYSHLLQVFYTTVLFLFSSSSFHLYVIINFVSCTFKKKQQQQKTLKFPLSTFNSAFVCLITLFHFHYELHVVYKVNNNTLNCLYACVYVYVFRYLYRFCMFQVVEK